MVLVWQGLGAYGFVVPFFSVVGGYLAAYVILGADVAKRFGTSISGIALLFSAAILWWMAKKLAARPTRVLVDKETGEEVTLSERHTMFYIPLRYWAIFFAIVGAFAVTAGLGQAFGLLPL
jgi:hypothetical protein